MKPKLCFVVPITLTYNSFLRDHMVDLVKEYNVTIIGDFSDEAPLDSTGLSFHSIKIQRKIAPFHDLWTLLNLCFIFQKENFDIIHTITPKAGLLGQLAGFFAGRGRRVHSITGQVWATRTGSAREVLKLIDRIIISLAHGRLADSQSQVAFLASEGINKNIVVLENGSIAGVDSGRFKPSRQARRLIRARHSIPDSSIVVSFLGRITKDKGVIDLDAAFRSADLGADATLIIMGYDEEGLCATLRSQPEKPGQRIIVVGRTSEHVEYLAASDIFSLPSYREGFGMSVLEAASTGLPVVTSEIPGLVDAVVKNETALCHPPGDVGALTACLERLARDPELRQRLGTSGRKRAVEKFRREKITAALLEFYMILLRDRSF